MIALLIVAVVGVAAGCGSNRGALPSAPCHLSEFSVSVGPGISEGLLDPLAAEHATLLGVRQRFSVAGPVWHERTVAPRSLSLWMDAGSASPPEASKPTLTPASSSPRRDEPPTR